MQTSPPSITKTGKFNPLKRSSIGMTSLMMMIVRSVRSSNTDCSITGVYALDRHQSFNHEWEKNFCRVAKRRNNESLNIFPA